MSKRKKTPFKVITDAPAFRARLGELTGNELKVWMYIWLHTNGELTAFPGNKTMARELQINIDTVKVARKGLRDKGWTTKDSRRRREDGTLSTTVEKVHLPWGENSTLDTMVEKTSDGKSPQQKEYSVNLEVPPSPAALEDSEIQNLEELINQPINQSVASSESEEETTSAHPSLEPERTWCSPSGIVYSVEDVGRHIDACWSAFKRWAIPTPEDVRLFTEVLAVCDDNQCYPEDAMEWAKTHILNPKLLGSLRSVKGLHRAICGEGVSPTNGLLAQFKDHNPKACGICLKKTPSSEPDSSRAERTPCLCGNNCKGFCPLEVEMESKPSGRGFSHEEAE